MAPVRNILALISIICLCARSASGDPPATHDIGPIGGVGANVSATGGLSFEAGVHVRDFVTLSGSATMMGEWYHAVIQARWFPIHGTWRPYVLSGVGELNDEDLFEDFIELGVGGEHRSGSGHWALYGEVAIDLPYSSRSDGMSISKPRSPEAGLGLRFYY
jgi:hypothetical protein